MKAMKTLWFWLTRYMVAIEWEGMRVVHWAKTEAEALEWVSGYPAAGVFAMYGKRGRMIAARWSAQ